MICTNTYTELVGRGVAAEAAQAASDTEIELDLDQRVFMANVLTNFPTYTVSEAASLAAGFEILTPVQ
ncbi:MAG: hypothetical protein LAT68_15790 [Cyclobacteriaceae bacterium]|nr:hypothetical protein [Cyclobacteriaceae bacterium]